jgi:hypothetical protein
LGKRDKFGFQLQNALTEAKIPALSGSDYREGSVALKTDYSVPMKIEDALNKTVDWGDPVIFDNLPTAERPVVLIPRTAEDEPYDMLLMIYRKSGIPLLTAINIEQIEKEICSTTNETGEFDFNLSVATQQQKTTDYFLSCRHEPIRDFNKSTTSVRGHKILYKNKEVGAEIEGGEINKKCVFDFVFMFFTTKQLKKVRSQKHCCTSIF